MIIGIRDIITYTADAILIFFFSDSYLRAHLFFHSHLTYSCCYADISSELSPPKPRSVSQVNFEWFILYLFTDAENRSAVALFPLKLSWANSFPIMGPLCPYLTWLYLNYVL